MGSSLLALEHRKNRLPTVIFRLTLISLQKDAFLIIVKTVLGPHLARNLALVAELVSSHLTPTVPGRIQITLGQGRGDVRGG
jgi:hypothetical protein